MQVGELFARLGLDMSEFQAGLNLARTSMQNTSRELIRQAQATSAALQGPERVLQNVNTRLQESTSHFRSFAQASNMPQVQQSFSQIESAIRQTRTELSRLGFGQTKAEIKATEAQLYNLANVRMTKLKDEISLTEKALKQMKESGRADEFTEEIRKAEEALAGYKRQLADAEPIKKFAQIAGYEVQKIFGKDVFVKPITDATERARAKISGFINQDLAAVANKTYEIIDNAAKKIVGAADTTAAQKAKIAQLPAIYQQIGMAAGIAAVAMSGVNAALAAMAAEAENAWNLFQAKTLVAIEDITEFQDIITDTVTSTGAGYEQIAQVFSHLKIAYDESKETIQESTELAFAFYDAWNTKPVEAIDSVRNVMKQLGVDQDQAADIMTLALRKYEGDIEKATKDVMAYGQEWKNATAAGTEGAQAFEKMNDALNQGAMGGFAEAWGNMKATLTELYQAVEPTLSKIAEGMKTVTQSVTEFLRNNPGIASFVAHMGLAATALTFFLAAGAPIAGFLIMHRGLFQGLAQAIVAASTGGVAVLSPQLVALKDKFLLFKNAIIGFPGVLASLGPAVLVFLRQIPNAIVNFVRLNPMLVAFGAIALVIADNWEQFGPIFTKIWDDIKLAFQPVMEAFKASSDTIFPALAEILKTVSLILADVLLGALQAIELIIRTVAQVINGDFNGALKSMGDLIGVFGDTKNGVQDLGAIVGIAAFAWAGYALAVKGAALATKAYEAAVKVATAAQWLWNIAMDANPIGILILAIGGLITAAVLLIDTWKPIKEFFLNMWSGIGENTRETWENIKNSVVEIATSLVNDAKTKLDELWTWIKETPANALQWGKDIINNFKNSIIEGITNLVPAAKDRFNQLIDWIRSLPGQALQWGKDTISSFIEGITSFHIKLPHLSIETGYKEVIGGWKIPYPDFKVNWYDAGGIFSGPSIIGVGEKRKEVVAPLETLSSMIKSAVSEVEGRGSEHKHTGTITFKGVTSKGQLVGAVDVVMDKFRQEARI